MRLLKESVDNDSRQLFKRTKGRRGKRNENEKRDERKRMMGKIRKRVKTFKNTCIDG